MGYQLYMYRSREPTEEPCIAVEIVDAREHTDARRFSGEECILVRDSEVPSDALETELFRRISSTLPYGAWTIADDLTAAQRLPVLKKDQAPVTDPGPEVYANVTWDVNPETFEPESFDGNVQTVRSVKASHRLRNSFELNLSL